jgi:hypothetical protein
LSRCLRAELTSKPCSGKLPIAHDTLRRDLQHLGGLFNAQATEEAQFNDARLSRIKGGEIVKSLVQSQRLGARLKTVFGYCVEIDGLGVSFLFRPPRYTVSPAALATLLPATLSGTSFGNVTINGINTQGKFTANLTKGDQLDIGTFWSERRALLV